MSSGSGRQVAVLVYGIGKRRFDSGARYSIYQPYTYFGLPLAVLPIAKFRLYAVTRPSIGRSPKLITMADITKRFIKVAPEDAKKLWEDQYEGILRDSPDVKRR